MARPRKIKRREPPKARNGEPTLTSHVEAWLKRGRRLNAAMAEKKWGITRQQYHGTISTLRRRLDIDSDERTITVAQRNGSKRRVIIATHTLVR